MSLFCFSLVDVLPSVTCFPSSSRPPPPPPPTLFVSAPLAKPGKKPPAISFSQDKSSGTSIQMITELGKKRLLSCRCSSAHQLLPLILPPGWTRGSLHSHGITLSTFHSRLCLELPRLVFLGHPHLLYLKVTSCCPSTILFLSSFFSELRDL